MEKAAKEGKLIRLETIENIPYEDILYLENEGIVNIIEDNLENDEETKMHNMVIKVNEEKIKAELKKVTWPTGKELFTNTSAVIFIVVVLAIIVFVLDVCFDKINNLGVSGVQKIISSTESEENSQETDDNVVELNDEEVQIVTENEVSTENTETTENKVTE